MVRRPAPRLVAPILAMALALAGCGIGAGHGQGGSRALPIVELERVPVTGANPELQRVVVMRAMLRVQVSPESDMPQWRVVRQLTLSRAQERRLSQDARAVHGWKHEPGVTCPGQPRGANVGQLILRVGRRATLCLPATAQPLLAFLGRYLPGSPHL